MNEVYFFIQNASYMVIMILMSIFLSSVTNVYIEVSNTREM